MSEDLRILAIECGESMRQILSPYATEHACEVEYLDAPDVLSGLDPDSPKIVLLSDQALQGDSDALLAALDQVRETTELIVVSEGRILDPPTLQRAFAVLPWPEARDEVEGLLDRAEHALAQRADDESAPQEDLAWIGALSTMLAHELSSPLDGSLRFMRLIRSQIDSGQDVHDYIDEVEDALDRMTRMVRSLLSFSRNAQEDRAPRPLSDLVEGAEAQVRRYVDRKDLHVILEGPEPAPVVAASLFQVFSNVIRNAFDAMVDGGRLGVDWQTDRETVLIQFDDEGPGIERADRDRAFEPFFTTKPYGTGTGLGLPICRRLVGALGGEIRLEDGPTGGCRVTIEVPLEDESEQRAKEERP